MTAEQVANLTKARTSSTKTPPVNNNAKLISQSPASTPVLPQTPEIKKATQKPAVSVVVSNQGGVDPETKVVASEIKKQARVQIETPEKPVEKPVKSKD